MNLKLRLCSGRLSFYPPKGASVTPVSHPAASSPPPLLKMVRVTSLYTKTGYLSTTTLCLCKKATYWLYIKILYKHQTDCREWEPNKLLSLIHCSNLLLVCHRSEFHCEILRTFDHGWSALLQMQMQHIDPPCSRTRHGFRIAQRVRVRQWVAQTGIY